MHHYLMTKIWWAGSSVLGAVVSFIYGQSPDASLLNTVVVAAASLGSILILVLKLLNDFKQSNVTTTTLREMLQTERKRNDELIKENTELRRRLDNV